eukprot:7389873-Prymnesium_polylepis.1
MDLDDFLAVDRLEPFEALKQRDMVSVVSGRGDDRAPVIFCSHQWLSWAHPDPREQPRQLVACQEALRRLRDGDVEHAFSSPLDAYKALGESWNEAEYTPGEV